MVLQRTLFLVLQLTEPLIHHNINHTLFTLSVLRITRRIGQVAGYDPGEAEGQDEYSDRDCVFRGTVPIESSLPDDEI